MNIIIKLTKKKGIIPESTWIDSSKFNNYTLPTFTKKIFKYLDQQK